MVFDEPRLLAERLSRPIAFKLADDQHDESFFQCMYRSGTGSVTKTSLESGLRRLLNRYIATDVPSYAGLYRLLRLTASLRGSLESLSVHAVCPNSLSALNYFVSQSDKKKHLPADLTRVFGPTQNQV